MPIALGGYANSGCFAIYRASHEDYEDSILQNGSFVGTAEAALDRACGLYLNDLQGPDLTRDELAGDTTIGSAMPVVRTSSRRAAAPPRS